MKHFILSGFALLLLASTSDALTLPQSEIPGSNLVAIVMANVAGTAETVLADSNGHSLYTFELDSAGVSKCSGGCLAAWPAMHVPAGSAVPAPFGTIKGNDGQLQLTLEGLPLYHFHLDQKPGDAFGQYPKWDVVVIQGN